MPTIMDVAREAAVGIGTVSRVLNGSPLVSERTRQRVLAAIDRLGYQPSAIARAFGRRRTDKIEVMVPLYAQSFVLEILRGVQDALADSDYTLLIHTAQSAAERDHLYQECCVRGRTEGVLIIWMAPTEALADRLTAEPFPVVLINSEHPRLPSVGVDHQSAAERAVAYCAGLGHRRIGLVDRAADPFSPASPGVCQVGYERAMETAGLPVPEAYERLQELSVAGGATGLNALLEQPLPPTAVIVGSEAQAIGALEAARAQGKRVPQDLSIVGYNDSDVSRDLGLTTVQVPLRELGSTATELLLLAALVEPGLAPEQTLLPSQLVVRRTCAPPPPL